MKLSVIAHSIMLLCVSGVSFAQDTTDNNKTVQRVEITGSSIKRVEAEGALPVQVITRQDIDRAGITSAEQLLATVSANVGGAFNMSANQAEGFTASTGTHNSGSSSANLRGLGPDSTLVLLNGRRIADHGLNGSSVDLNSIPFSAIERVEVLKDGASAIYGTDAIGGVINFILRTDYQGLEANVSGDMTQHRGGNIYNASLLFGKGSLVDDGYNFMATLAVDKNSALQGSQRSFQNGYQPARGLAPDTVGTPYATQRLANPVTLPGSTQQYGYANLLGLQGNCSTYPQMHPYPTDLWANPYRALGCSYDYGADWALMQPEEHQNLVSRASYKLDASNTVYFELTASHTSATDVYTPIQVSGFTYPAGGMYYQDLSAYIPGYDPTQDINLRWRCVPCGKREETTASTTYRALFGIDGLIEGWDYKAGLSMAGSNANTDLVNGYVNSTLFQAALNTGLINPFALPGQAQTAAGLAALNSAKVTGQVYSGHTRLIQADGSASKEIANWNGNAISSALGFDLRRETYEFNSNSNAANNIYQATSDPSLNQVSRNIIALYGELLVPIVKQLEADLAVRHDRYSDFGGTTNPKVSLRYQPISSLMLRTSWSTGFHAPDFEQMYAGQTPNTLNNAEPDPILCPKNPGNPTYCSQNWNYQTGGNLNLKAEKSKQVSAGFVVSPLSNLSATVDYWNIKRTNRIVTPDPAQVLASDPSNVIRNADGTINYIEAGFMNIAQDDTKGIDLGMKWDEKIAGDHWYLNLDGTYMISHSVQNSPQSSATEFVGQFGDPNNGYADLYLRWRHTASLTWKHQNWTTTLTEQYNRGYYDEVPVGIIPPGFNPRVSSYNLYNLGVGYAGFDNTTINFTIKNLFDKDPPFSAHSVDDVVGAGWDAREGQPRLRAFMLALKYKFY